MVTLLLSTRNAHKVTELRNILGAGFRCLTLDDFPGAPEVIEDASTFAGNATKKAVELARWMAASPGSIEVPAGFVLADDSGLEVDALNGAPGVISARFAAIDSTKNSSTEANNAKLLRLLRDVPTERRTARFCCVIALTPISDLPPQSTSPVCAADEFELSTELFDGVCEGRITFEPHGKEGFGYDPLFIPDGYDLSFAELGEEIKNDLSHRGKALSKLKQALEAKTK